MTIDFTSIRNFISWFNWNSRNGYYIIHLSRNNHCQCYWLCQRKIIVTPKRLELKKDNLGFNEGELLGTSGRVLVILALIAFMV